MSKSEVPPTPQSDEAKSIQLAFGEMLNLNPVALINSCRDDGEHVVLNADDLFHQWPQYAEDPVARRWLGAILYPVAKKFIDAAYRRLLSARPTQGTSVVFTAGGGASGKSTVLRAQANRPDVDFIVDTTFSNLERSKMQIAAALEAGREVEINYVYRAFDEAVVAMIRRALDPKVGRIVPIDDLAGTHAGAQETLLAMMEEYSDEPRVAFQLWESRSGSTLRRLSVLDLPELALPTLDAMKERGQAILDEIFERANRDPAGEWKDLSGNRSFYEAARSKA